MPDFIEWYFPWSLLDWGLKIGLILWGLAILAGLIIYIRTIIFRKPWLTLHHMQLPKEEQPSHK